MRLRLFLGGSVFVLTACAVTPLPSLPISHPASPAAAEVSPPASPGLSTDPMSNKTRELLSGTTSGGNSMPGMNH